LWEFHGDRNSGHKDEKRSAKVVTHFNVRAEFPVAEKNNPSATSFELDSHDNIK